MTRLTIAEKHSVAQAIAQALDTSAIRKDGYLQCADTLVTWAQGHLVNLATPDQYQDHDWGRWRMDTLPLDPSPDWKLVVNRQKGADRQFKTVQQLIQRDDVTTLINACDPDREASRSSVALSNTSVTMPAWTSRPCVCGSPAWKNPPSDRS